MALGDLFKAKENDQLKHRVAELEAMLTPEMRDLTQLRATIRAHEKTLIDLNAQCSARQDELTSIQSQIAQARTDLVELITHILIVTIKSSYTACFSNQDRFNIIQISTIQAVIRRR